jgi:hypothetical protein
VAEHGREHLHRPRVGRRQPRAGRELVAEDARRHPGFGRAAEEAQLAQVVHVPQPGHVQAGHLPDGEAEQATAQAELERLGADPKIDGEREDRHDFREAELRLSGRIHS